jgi:creatinine amidohydrolase/Fe(II)-dependent formamide hydrolase-like protein
MHAAGRAALAMLCLWIGVAGAVRAAPPATVHIEELTWTELRDRIAAGATTVIIPVGGTEQNGPHMVLGKHNVRVRWLAERIAQKLGRTVVAPVVAYVPEGTIEPPSQHMRYVGTITVPEAAFEAMLESAARSLRHHGLRDVVLIGDHGGYQKSLERVAAKFAASAAAGGRVIALPEYYRASGEEHARLLTERGFAAAEIGQHAGLADTSLALAVEPSLVRSEALASVQGDGVSGNPRRATAELGRLGVDRIVELSVLAIRTRLGRGAEPQGARAP